MKKCLILLLCCLLLMIACNLVADGLREAFDTRTVEYKRGAVFFGQPLFCAADGYRYRKKKFSREFGGTLFFLL